jgi:hypothetical protein
MQVCDIFVRLRALLHFVKLDDSINRLILIGRAWWRVKILFF